MLFAGLGSSADTPLKLQLPKVNIIRSRFTHWIPTRPRLTLPTVDHSGRDLEHYSDARPGIRSHIWNDLSVRYASAITARALARHNDAGIPPLHTPNKTIRRRKRSHSTFYVSKYSNHVVWVTKTKDPAHIFLFLTHLGSWLNTTFIPPQTLAGCDEAVDELEEVVMYLEDPTSFTRLGGKLPKGIMLTGPPGRRRPSGDCFAVLLFLFDFADIEGRCIISKGISKENVD